jgi:hypothetical protein
VLHALPISFSLTWSFSLFLAKGASYEAPHYAVFSVMSLHLSSVQILSSVPCSQTPAVYISPLISEIKFCTHTDPKANVVLYSLIFMLILLKQVLICYHRSHVCELWHISKDLLAIFLSRS